MEIKANGAKKDLMTTMGYLILAALRSPRLHSLVHKWVALITSLSHLNLRSLPLVLVLLLLFAPAGCGGGGGNGGGGNGGGGGGGFSNADFSLTVTPSNITLTAGTSTSVSLLAKAINGFSSTISVQVGGIPSGVSIAPSTITLQPGVAQQVTLMAANSAAITSGTLTFTGNGGSSSHGVQLGISLIAALLPSRTHYARTDSVTEYFLISNEHWAVYSPLTNRVFVADPVGNHVMVMDVSTRTRIATLDVPGAFGIDDTPDHTKVYVGTLIGDVYTVDAVGLTVTGRFLASQIGPFGFAASTALVLSDGRLALTDGSLMFAVWNPVDNSFTAYATPFTASFVDQPVTTVCGPLEDIADLTRSADRTQLFVGSADSDSTLCQVNASTGSFNFNTMASFPLKLSVSPDGKYLATRDFSNGGSVLLVDANTLALLSQFPVNGDTSSGASIAFSADSSTLFVSSSSIVYAYSVTTHQQTGWLPNLVVEPISGGSVEGPISGPDILPVGNTGLLAGPMEEGVGFLDVGAMHTGTVGTLFLNGYLAVPFGPAGGGTTVSLPDPNPLQSTVNSVYFGSQRSPSVGVNGGLLSITTPSGSPGVVDVDVLMNDGGQWLLPEGFSYGPTVIEATPNASTAEGGGTCILYGYGFGPVTFSNAIPSDLQIAVGGNPATITGYDSDAYGLEAPPFQLEAVAFRIPPGTAGSSVDITVSNSSGTTTVHGGLSYLAPIQRFSSGTTALAQGIYDSHRDVYYFSDTNQIRVFSRTQSKFLTSINIPPPQPLATQRLWGIALSPDGTKLAIADAAANAIYLVNPDVPATVKTFPLPSPSSSGVTSNPSSVAVSDAGMVYYTAFVSGGTGFSSFFKLDTSSGQVTDYKIAGPGLETDILLRTLISSDNARVFFNNDGDVFSLDTATDKIFPATDDPGCCGVEYDLALSNNQTQFAAAGFLYDSDLNGESFITLNDREVMNIAYFFGMKLSPDGTLLFQPSTTGIDVFDGRVGTLLNRIALPIEFSATFDALVSDGKDNVLVGIVGPFANQIAVIDLSSVPEPSPLPYVAVRRTAHTNSAPESMRVPEAALKQKARARSKVSQGNRPRHATSGQPLTLWPESDRPSPRSR